MIIFVSRTKRGCRKPERVGEDLIFEIMYIGEELCGEYLKHICKCDFVLYNTSTTGSTVGQGEIDVIGVNQSLKKVYVCEVAVHVRTGLQYTKSSRPNVYGKVKAKFDRDIPYVSGMFPGYEIVPMFWSAIVKNTDSNPAQNELIKVKDHVKNTYGCDLQLIINEKWEDCINKLKEVAAATTTCLSGVMRVFQIEEYLKSYLSNYPKSIIPLP